jgi:hypothetical protein
MSIFELKRTIRRCKQRFVRPDTPLDLPGERRSGQLRESTYWAAGFEPTCCAYLRLSVRRGAAHSQSEFMEFM